MKKKIATLLIALFLFTSIALAAPKYIVKHYIGKDGKVYHRVIRVKKKRIKYVVKHYIDEYGNIRHRIVPVSALW